MIGRGVGGQRHKIERKANERMEEGQRTGGEKRTKEKRIADMKRRLENW
jgi:hypothetical protein